METRVSHGCRCSWEYRKPRSVRLNTEEEIAVKRCTKQSINQLVCDDIARVQGKYDPKGSEREQFQELNTSLGVVPVPHQSDKTVKFKNLQNY